WKTYWRSPGDSGVPPQFDWSGAANVAQATPLWPRPEVIESGGERTLGYHDRLVLPIALTPAAPGQPMAGQVQQDMH
ncbi:protein-disulfide reductase DsbD domain-containing protein, partial [Streptomyces sp. URMC 126]|uniref:protein-disulfide reductase DsbD domain-containing protein n=1 Tax=Streptomyces sp. URMC 126 TaxID=3423401 RepID=UPI003F529D3D